MKYSIHALFVSQALATLPLSHAEARIRCNGPWQIVPGAGEISTPYCEDANLARVARTYGIRVTAAEIRTNNATKSNVCRMIGYDNRVTGACHYYGSDGRNHGGR